MRRIALLATGVLIPLVPATPAFAAARVICVNNPIGVSCDEGVSTIAEAISSANANVVDDAITIRVAPGTYNGGPYFLDGSAHQLTLQGSGQGTTNLTMDASASSQTYVFADHATIRDLTLTMNPTSSEGDIGVAATSSTVDAVTVIGADTQDATGIVVSDGVVSSSTVQMDLAQAANSRGIYSDSAATVTDSTIVASYGFAHSSAGVMSTLSRVSIKASWSGISTDWGTVVVDDALIDLGTAPSASGLEANNGNPSTVPKSIAANHVTIVGGGIGSKGVYAGASAAGALQQASVQLHNSIVSGPTTDLDVEADNNGAQGANSTATITTSYSVWSSTNVVSGPHGDASIQQGPGHLTVNPLFRNPSIGDYRLAAGSPVIDKGTPGTGAPTLDLAKGARVLDGNGDGIAVRDMGAYEAPKKVIVADTTAPSTTFTSKPGKRVAKRRVTFKFASNESPVTFQCKLDAKPWRSCTSPKRVRVTLGWHVFKVRARDAAGNVDPTPARYRFKRVRG